MGPLAGIRIIDMTTVLMGPSATQMLADMGADVVKVEPPAGDVMRQIGPARHAGMGPLFLNSNRNKRSIVLDLKHPEGRDALIRLASDADILVYNVRPLAMARLGLGYEMLAQRNPRLIYAGLFGYGQQGPYAARPAYDDLIQGGVALSSLLARSGDGTPRYVPTAMADRVCGLAAVGAICATLVERERSGCGQRLDIPMFETMVNFVLSDHLGGLTFEPPLDCGGYARQLSPERRPYRTSDGFICALVYNDKQWASFLDAVGRSELKNDPRFADFVARSQHVDHVYGELASIFLTRTTSEWLELLETADIPSLPMHDIESLLEDPHLVATDHFALVEHPTEGKLRNLRLPLDWSRTQPEKARLAPNLGEHGIEILRERGFREEEIERLIACEALRLPKPEASVA